MSKLERVCTLELNTGMTRIRCSKCGWEVPPGSDPNAVKVCPECKRLVAYEQPWLFLIGPVTGRPNDNRLAFVQARKALKSEGYGCDIPHDYIPEGTPWQDAMRISIRQMLANKVQSTLAQYDGIALLDGWEESAGAKIEKQTAEALGIPCRPWRDYINPAANGAALASGSALQPIFAPAC